MRTRKVKATLPARDIVLEFKPNGQIKSVEGMGEKWVRTTATDAYLMANVELEELPTVVADDDKPRKKTRRSKSSDSETADEEDGDAQSL